MVRLLDRPDFRPRQDSRRRSPCLPLSPQRTPGSRFTGSVAAGQVPSEQPVAAGARSRNGNTINSFRHFEKRKPVICKTDLRTSCPNPRPAVPSHSFRPSLFHLAAFSLPSPYKHRGAPAVAPTHTHLPADKRGGCFPPGSSGHPNSINIGAGGSCKPRPELGGTAHRHLAPVPRAGPRCLYVSSPPSAPERGQDAVKCAHHGAAAPGAPGGQPRAAASPPPSPGAN